MERALCLLPTWPTRLKSRVNAICGLILLLVFSFAPHRAVIKGQGPGISPGYYERGPWLLSKENKRKIEPKEIPSCLIPRLLVVFTLQLEILVTLPCPQVFFLGTPISPLSSKTNISKFQFNQGSGRWRTTNCYMDVLPLNHYLLLYFFYTCRFNMKSVLVCTCISHVINPLESNQEQKEQLLLILSTNCSCWQLGSKPM